jgi:uncharacterized membrane protein YphA (DoxX/SURF4 family)
MGETLQRLYSTFADGWPGAALLLQRIVVAVTVVCCCGIYLADSPFSVSMIPHIIGACAGVLLLLGLWTPFAGALIALVEFWLAMTHASDPWMSTLLATVGGTSAMLGPGAFSLDARLFGRRHLDL